MKISYYNPLKYKIGLVRNEIKMKKKTINECKHLIKQLETHNKPDLFEKTIKNLIFLEKDLKEKKEELKILYDLKRMDKITKYSII